VRHVEQVMGTAVSIELVDGRSGLVDDVCAWLHEVDARFSTYRDDSEVCRLRRGEITAADCSPGLRHVLSACTDLWRDTDGYFDAYALGPLDPSGYVKGWSVEVASERLLAAGCANHYINAGGDIRTRGHQAGGAPWKVGIRHPAKADKLAWVLALTDGAVATSGTYERGGHVINPRTGMPSKGLRSVTVVGPTLALADAYATAALAMGDEALPWLAKLATEGYESAAVTDDGRAFTSAGLPVAAA
jgi:thiamine biosynthesis lipoprotein